MSLTNLTHGDPRWLLIAALYTCTAFAQTAPPVSLELFPKDLSMAAGETRRVVVVARVAKPVRKLILEIRPDAGTKVAVAGKSELPGEVHGDVSWAVSITKPSDHRSSAKVLFQARYEYDHQPQSGPPRTIAGLAAAVADVTVKPRPKLEEIATARLEFKADKLEERRPVEVYFVLTAKADVPLQVLSVRASLPAFARAVPPPKDQSEGKAAYGKSSKGPPEEYTRKDGWYELFPATGRTEPLEIAPGGQHIFHLLVSIPKFEPVLSGKYLMVLDTSLSYQKDGYSNQAHLFSTQEFQAGVLGETEFVGSTAVPFVLLPGFLFVAVVSLLFGKVWPKWSFSFDYKKPEFYLLGTMVSILWLFLYPPVSPLLYKLLYHTRIAPRDYLSGYSITDIVNVWMLAAASGLLLWIVPGGVWAIIAMLRARHQKDRTPTPSDQPLELMRKLALAKQPLNLAEVTVGGKTLWELPLLSPDPAKKWVSGRIGVRFVSSLTAEETSRFQELVALPLQATAVYDYLSRLQNRVALHWKPDNEGPRLVANGEAPRIQHSGDQFLYQQA